MVKTVALTKDRLGVFSVNKENEAVIAIKFASEDIKTNKTKLV